MARPAPPEAPVTLDDLRARREELLRIVEAHRATNVRVFGSVARGVYEMPRLAGRPVLNG